MGGGRVLLVVSYSWEAWCHLLGTDRLHSSVWTLRTESELTEETNPGNAHHLLYLSLNTEG